MPNLPAFELSYGLDRHSKVAPDAFMLAPKGQRVIVAFISRPDGDSCYVCQLNRHQRICSYTRVLACFSRELCAGTLLYGVRAGSGDRVVVEDVLHWMGKPVTRDSLVRKAALFEDLFNRHLGKPPSSRYLQMGLPVWEESMVSARDALPKIGYECRGILAFSTRARGMRPLSVSPPHRPTASHDGVGLIDKAVLVARAREEQDTYSLFAQDASSSLVEIGHAAVHSLATSVFMNSLFRKIKENANLDLLEESDSDDEFECVDADKFVDLEKEVALNCAFEARFGAWVPVSVAAPGAPVSLEGPVRSALAQPRGFSARSTHGPPKHPKGRIRRRSPACELHGSS